MSMRAVPPVNPPIALTRSHSIGRLGRPAEHIIDISETVQRRVEIGREEHRHRWRWWGGAVAVVAVAAVVAAAVVAAPRRSS